MAGWSHERGLLEAEVTQRRDEGCTIPQTTIDAIANLQSTAQVWDEAQSAPLWAALDAPHGDARLASAEPNDLDGIRALRPDGPRDLQWHPGEAELVDRMDREDVLRRMSPVHTINNAVACVLALLYAQPQIDAAACAAVSAGIDTDCNGATVGSVIGAMTGRDAYRGSLAVRLNDTIKPEVFGFQEVRMKELARRHAAVWRRVDAWVVQRDGR